MGAIDIAVLRTCIKLDSEVVADEGLVRNGLRGTYGHANAVFVGGLSVCMKTNAGKKHNKQYDNVCSFHNGMVLFF
jgi:hypothetical protein